MRPLVVDPHTGETPEERELAIATQRFLDALAAVDRYTPGPLPPWKRQWWLVRAPMGLQDGRALLSAENRVLSCGRYPRRLCK